MRSAVSIIFSVLFFSCHAILLDEKPQHSIHDWQYFGNTIAHTNSVPYSIPPPLNLIWTYKGSAAFGNSVIVVDSILYAGNLDGQLVALNAITGVPIGEIKVNYSIESNVLVHNSTLVFSRAIGKETVFAYDLLKGKFKWKRSLGGIETAPLQIENRLYIAGLNSVITCLDFSSGELLWKYETAKPIRSTPAISGDYIVVGNDAGELTCLNHKTGEMIWKIELQGSIFASPVIYDNHIFFGTSNNKFFKVKLWDGSIQWSFNTNGMIYSTATVTKDHVAFGCNDGYLRVLDIESGELVWDYYVGSVINTAPVTAGKYIYAGSLNRFFYGFDLVTGELIWQYKTHGRIITSPIIWDETVYVASEDRYLYAFRK